METRGEVDQSFERLYRLHSREVYGAALRELGNVQDAEDVTQAAFVDAYRAILRGSRPESPRAWLLAIAENVRRRRFRAARSRPTEQPVAAEALPAPELPHEQAQVLRAALRSLAPPQREVFLLREIRGLSYEEIAARADSSVGAVQMLLFRARQALRAELEPPSTAGRARALSWPVWLVQFAGRADRSFLTPRGAGAIGAAALVLGASAAGPVEVRGDSAGGPAELRGDSAARTPVQPRQAAPAALDEVRSARGAERRPAVRRARTTVVQERPATRNDLVSAPVVQAPAVPSAPVGEPEPAVAQPTALATTATAGEVEARVVEPRKSELAPVDDITPALPVPLSPSDLPEPPPVEPALPAVEVPPVEPPRVELPPLAPVELPPEPPPTTVPLPLP